MHNRDEFLNRYEIRNKVDKLFEYDKWFKLIPYINFPERFEIKIIPPFMGAIVRFHIRDKKHKNTHVSAYLDCYDMLGYVGEPYWEIYPNIEGDTSRYDLNDIHNMIQEIIESIDSQINE